MLGFLGPRSPTSFALAVSGLILKRCSLHRVSDLAPNQLPLGACALRFRLSPAANAAKQSSLERLRISLETIIVAAAESKTQPVQVWFWNTFSGTPEGEARNSVFHTCKMVAKFFIHHGWTHDAPNASLLCAWLDMFLPPQAHDAVQVRGGGSATSLLHLGHVEQVLCTSGSVLAFLGSIPARSRALRRVLHNRARATERLQILTTVRVLRLRVALAETTGRAIGRLESAALAAEAMITAQEWRKAPDATRGGPWVRPSLSGRDVLELQAASACKSLTELLGIPCASESGHLGVHLRGVSLVSADSASRNAQTVKQRGMLLPSPKVLSAVKRRRTSGESGKSGGIWEIW